MRLHGTAAARFVLFRRLCKILQMPEIPGLMTEREVAELLRLKRQTLSRWRAEERGPPFVQVEGSIRYPREAVQRWLDERTLGGTLPA